jgi:hypothetical protein
MCFDAVTGKNRNVFFLAPTQKQGRSIIWEDLKKRLDNIGEANESRLEMRVPTQDGGHSTIFIAGWENRENFRGMKAYKIIFDEVDTMRDFFIGWQEIFRPALTDTGGGAIFSGTPKKENPNLRRLEKIAEKDSDYQAFHFTTRDNPYINPQEIDKAKQELDQDTYRQEYEAEYIDNAGALFHYDSLVDVFSNTVEKDNEKYLIVDIADDGSDKTIFSFWEGMEEYLREEFAHLNTEGIIEKIREYAARERIPMSHIAVDSIGVGAGVASSSLLDGIIGYKSSYAPIKTDQSIVHLPNVGHNSNVPLISEYKNLRSQCVFTLADNVNQHKIASRCTGRQKEVIIEELSVYQDASQGDGKRMATQKEDVKEIIGRSPDCFIAGTKVKTPNGETNIENLKVGDEVTTPFGSTKIAYTIEKQTDVLYTIDSILTGTGNHRIFSGSSFSPLDTYIIRVYNYYISNKYNNYIWKILSLLSIRLKNIGFRGLVDISTIAHTKTELSNQDSLSTGKYGKIQTKKKFPKDLIYTTLTVILLIITRIIWLVLEEVSIILSTLKNIGWRTGKKESEILIRREKWLASGINQQKEGTGIKKTQSSVGKKQKEQAKSVKDAVSPIKVLGKMASVLTIAVKSFIIELKNITRTGNVSFAERLLVSGVVNKPKLVQEVAVQKVDGIKVYSLTLENHNVYFANNILVENCSDTWIMRMYFVIRGKMVTERAPFISKQNEYFDRAFHNQKHNSAR